MKNEIEFLQKQVEDLKYRRDVLDSKVKAAWQRAIFSYQFFAEDRETYQKLSRQRCELDLDLAEIDGRLKKCKPAGIPQRRKTNGQSSTTTTPSSMSKPQLLDFLKSLSKEEKDSFLAALCVDVALVKEAEK